MRSCSGSVSVHCVSGGRTCCAHELSGQSQLSVRPQHGQRSDVSVRLRGVLLPVTQPTHSTADVSDSQALSVPRCLARSLCPHLQSVVRCVSDILAST